MICFEHGVVYDEDDMMCPVCESEVCEENDPTSRTNLLKLLGRVYNECEKLPNGLSRDIKSVINGGFRV